MKIACSILFFCLPCLSFGAHANMSIVLLDSVVTYSDDNFPHSKVCFDYNGDGLRTGETNYVCDFDAATWLPTSRIESSYNAAGNETEETKYVFDNQSFIWKIHSKIQTEYFDDEIRSATYRLDSLTQQLQALWQVSRSLSPENNTYSATVYQRKNDGWTPCDQYLTRWNIQNNTAENAVYQFDSDSDAWKLQYLSDLSFPDNQGLGVSTLYRNGQNHSALTIDYNELNLPITEIRYRWDKAREDWIDLDLTTYQYNADRQLVEMTSKRRDSDTLMWQNQQKTVYQYSSDSLLSVLQDFIWNDSWNLTQTRRYFYSVQTVRLPDVAETQSIRIYPNPVQNTFTISGITETSQLLLIDMNGTIRLNRQIRPNEKIDVNTLASGTYMLVISTQNQHFSRKLVKISF